VFDSEATRSSLPLAFQLQAAYPVLIVRVRCGGSVRGRHSGRVLAPCHPRPGPSRPGPSLPMLPVCTPAPAPKSPYFPRFDSEVDQELAKCKFKLNFEVGKMREVIPEHCSRGQPRTLYTWR
jgi:hypothetical protein